MEHFPPLATGASWRAPLQARCWALRARLVRLTLNRWRLRIWRDAQLRTARHSPLANKRKLEQVSARLRFCEESRKDCLLALELAREKLSGSLRV